MNDKIKDLVSKAILKETPRKVSCCLSSLPENRIVGYCPNCNGTVDIRLTALVKIKGHRCSWCGQAIDLTGVNYMYEE